MQDDDKGMGIAWSIPRDGRIRLSFDRVWLRMFVNTIEGFARVPEMSTKTLESMMERIKDFHGKLKTSGDFCVLDSDVTSEDPILAMYKPGSGKRVLYKTLVNRLVLVIALYGDLLYSP